MFAYELRGCGFESCCSHLNFRYYACFKRGVPWDSGNYRVWIQCETCTWRDKNIKSQSKSFIWLTFFLWIFFTFENCPYNFTNFYIFGKTNTRKILHNLSTPKISTNEIFNFFDSQKLIPTENFYLHVGHGQIDCDLGIKTKHWQIFQMTFFY